MIQRIQSLYLLLATVAMIIISFETSIYSKDELVFMVQDDTKMFILTLGAALLGVVSIGVYKNRKWQMKLIRLALVLNFVIAVRLFLLWKAFEVALNNNFITVLIIASIAFLLAYRGVKKDDDLVRSVDRIR